MTMPPVQAVKVFEVGPRDGLKNERQQLSVATRVALIGALAVTSSALMRTPTWATACRSTPVL